MPETIQFTTASYPSITYNRRPFPVVVLDGVPWFSTAHVQFAVRSRFRPSDCDYFNPQHVGAHRFPSDAADEESHMVSFLAALELGSRDPMWKVSRMFTGWLRKRDPELRTSPSDTLGPLYAVRAARPHPPMPFDSDVLMGEWRRWRDEHAKAFPPAVTSFPARLQLPPVPRPSFGRSISLTA